MRSVDSKGTGLYGKYSPEIGIIWVADIFSQMEGNMHMTVNGEVICAHGILVPIMFHIMNALSTGESLLSLQGNLMLSSTAYSRARKLDG